MEQKGGVPFASESGATILVNLLEGCTVQARVLEESQRPESTPVIKRVEATIFPNRHLVDVERDRGPFFGLPDRVRELYKVVISCHIFNHGKRIDKESAFFTVI